MLDLCSAGMYLQENETEHLVLNTQFDACCLVLEV